MDNLEEFRKRRERFFNEMKDCSIAVFVSNPESIMSNDVTYYYRQNTDLYYLSGFEEPNTFLIFEKKGDLRKFSMIVPPKDPLFETWNGRRAGVEGAKENFGAEESFSNEDLEKILGEKLPEYERVYYEHGLNTEADDVILPLIRKSYKSRTKSGDGPHTITNPTIIVEKFRTIKSEYELQLMREANEISIKAHLAAIKSTKPGKMEYELEAEYMHTFYRNGARRPAYTSIVGSGINATILHYIENNDRLNDGELVLADCAAEYKYYAADITRTWPVNGRFSEVQKKVYQIVLDTMNECIEMCKPGVVFKDISDLAIRRITEGLIKLGLLEGEVDKLIEEKTYRRFFMHGLGHWLGIDTHDTSRIPLMQTTLQPGMVFTIEPGIYIPDDEDIPEMYRGIGVRIEDDICVTENGHENLSASLPKTIEEIENLMREKVS